MLFCIHIFIQHLVSAFHVSKVKRYVLSLSRKQSKKKKKSLLTKDEGRLHEGNVIKLGQENELDFSKQSRIGLKGG